jgi:hypothetical protein
MARSARGLHRLIGARQSRTIPVGTLCHFAPRCTRTATHVLLPAMGRHYVCETHAKQGQELGYEVFSGSQKCDK